MTVRDICKLGDLDLFRRKNKTLSKIAGPGLTSAGSFEVVLSSKNESGIAQLFVRNLNRAT